MTEAYLTKLSQAAPADQPQHLIVGAWVSRAIAVVTEAGSPWRPRAWRPGAERSMRRQVLR